MESTGNVKLILASQSKATGIVYWTFQIKIWKVLLAELNTHRSLSRNASSSRAIPMSKMRERAAKDPFMPVFWGANQKGMQARSELKGDALENAKAVWFRATQTLIALHEELEETGLHKQLVNRFLEPIIEADVVVSGTELSNFFKQRACGEPQPEFAVIATEMEKIARAAQPQALDAGAWHIPYIHENDAERIPGDIAKQWTLDLPDHLRGVLAVSAARCARASYFMPDGNTTDPAKDMELALSLLHNMHISPFEHQAMALPVKERHGNVQGWKQQRKFIVGENGGDYEGPSSQEP